MVQESPTQGGEHRSATLPKSEGLAFTCAGRP
jgi:hypothetical protein